MIRDAGLNDADRLGAAHVIAAEEAYGHYFPAEFMKRHTAERRTHMWAETLSVAEPKPRVVVAEHGEQIIGFGAFGPARDSDLTWLSLVPDFRGRGWGVSRMVDSLLMREDQGHGSIIDAQEVQRAVQG